MTDARPLLKATHASCTCPVCLDVFKDPVGFHCGHVLCRTCAVRCITARPRCPLCNRPVPNVRHLLPLPQLSLFCTLARELGVRVHPPRVLPTPSTTGVGGDAHNVACARVRTATEHVSSTTPPRQRRRRETSPPTPPPPTSPPPLLQQCESVTDHLAGRLWYGNAGDTQRLQSESPQRPPSSAAATAASFVASAQTLHDLSSPAQATKQGLLGLTSETNEDHRDVQAEHHGGAVTSEPVTTTTAAFSATTPPFHCRTALLQNRLAEVAEELESTPCLTSIARAGEEEVMEEDGAPHEQRRLSCLSADSLQPGVRFSAGSTWWRVWRRGHGVVHCSLIPPAVRVQAAVRAKQEEGDGDATEGVKVGGRGRPQRTTETTKTGRTSRGGDVKLAATTSAALSTWETTRLHRSGCCVLCGLDVVQRGMVRHRLQRLLHSPAAQCDPTELAAQTEDGLSLLLGPLWGVCGTVDTQAAASTPTSKDYAFTAAASCGTGWGEGRVGGDAKTLRAVAHHNCLAWAGLLDVYTDTSPHDVEAEEGAAIMVAPTSTSVLRMTVPLADPFALVAAHTSGRVACWQLLMASLWHTNHSPHPCHEDATDDDDGGRSSVSGSPHCVLCTNPTTMPAPPSSAVAMTDFFGAGLRTCEGTERGESSCGRHFHYPCALLAGAAACLVFGLEDDDNVLTASQDGTCVRNTKAESGKPTHPVEVWCGPCHERHKTRRRSRQRGAAE
jgi:hypothetical protein